MLVIPGSPQTSLSDCRVALRDRRLVRYLYACVSGNRSLQPLLLKQEFVNFVKGMIPSKENPLTDSETADVFLLFCKKLEGGG